MHACACKECACASVTVHVRVCLCMGEKGGSEPILASVHYVDGYNLMLEDVCCENIQRARKDSYSW